MEESLKKIRFKTVDLMYVAMFAAVISLCAWISVPYVVAFTMQTFGVYCALCLLGGKRGFCAVAVYVLLGIAGAPVFAGFSGGVGVIAGPTGGYVLGFLVCALTYAIITAIGKNSKASVIIGLTVGTALCYLFGTLWYCVVYARASGGIGFGGAMMACVVPFIIPDAIKLIMALTVRKQLLRFIPE